MKIFIVGSDKIFAIENFYVKYLQQLGIDVFHFTAQSQFYDYYQEGIVNKIMFKAGLSNILVKINKKFKTEVAAFEPDVIWVFKGMEIFPKSLQWAKKRKIKLINYNGDSPFLFSGKGSGNAHVSNSISLYDLHLTYNSAVKKEMEAVYKIPTIILPFGFDLDETGYQKCCLVDEVVKVCFVGNPDKYRSDFLQQLAENGITIDVYGNGWSNFLQHKNVTIYAPVYGDEGWKVLRKYRVQLNLMRPHNPDTHNMRSFEVPAVGGIQLAPDTPDHRFFFEADKEIFLFNTVEDCILQINKLLSLPQEQALLIRDNARNRSIEAGYSYKHRASQVLTAIKALYE